MLKQVTNRIKEQRLQEAVFVGGGVAYSTTYKL